MNIPAKAVEEAHEQLEAMGAYVSPKYVAAALEAAAPHMQAGAWGDGLQCAYEEGYLTRPQLEALQEANPHRRKQ